MMAVVLLASATGSPGVTTTALGLALAWPRHCLVADCDRDPSQAVQAGYLRGMEPEARPRFVLFGESLGALTMQDIWRRRTVAAMDRDFVHSSIFLGTPSGTEFAKAGALALRLIECFHDAAAAAPTAPPP